MLRDKIGLVLVFSKDVNFTETRSIQVVLLSAHKQVFFCRETFRDVNYEKNIKVWLSWRLWSRLLIVGEEAAALGLKSRLLDCR